MSLKIGQLNIPHFMVAGIVSILILYAVMFVIVKEKQDRKKYFDFTFNILILLFVAWKVTSLSLGLNAENPLDFLYLPGGSLGRIIGYVSITLYSLFYWYRKRDLFIPVIGTLFILLTATIFVIIGSLNFNLLTKDEIVYIRRLGFDLNNEKPLVINFWATWCPPCRAELPELNDFYYEHKDSVTFYGVNLIDSEKVKVEDFILEQNILFPIVYDRGGDITDFFEISSIPVTIVIVKVEKGYEIKKHSGAVTKSILNEMIK